MTPSTLKSKKAEAGAASTPGSLLDLHGASVEAGLLRGRTIELEALGLADSFAPGQKALEAFRKSHLGAFGAGGSLAETVRKSGAFSAYARPALDASTLIGDVGGMKATGGCSNRSPPRSTLISREQLRRRRARGSPEPART
jgi:hypothetical protein